MTLTFQKFSLIIKSKFISFLKLHPNIEEYRWFRKLSGGSWYRLYSVFLGSSIVIWTNNKPPEFIEIVDCEHYSHSQKQLTAYRD